MNSDMERLSKKIAIKSMNNMNIKDDLTELCAQVGAEELSSKDRFMKKRLMEDLKAAELPDIKETIRNKLRLLKSTYEAVLSYRKNGNFVKAENEFDYLNVLSVNIGMDIARIEASESAISKSKQYVEALASQDNTTHSLAKLFDVYYNDISFESDDALYCSISRLTSLILLSDI